MNSKFIIRKSQKTILSLNIKLSKNSKLGELDIMIDSANGIPFDKVIAGDYYKSFNNTIHSISWHGYYQNSTDNKIKLPTIHFKDNMQIKHKYQDLRHMGAINSNEPFAFPICSLYVPSDDVMFNILNISQYSTRNNKYYFKDINENYDCRIDIFITPKDLSATRILEGDMGYLYKMGDVPLFNTKQGIFTVLKEIRDNPNRDYNSFIEIYSLESGHNIIVRTVGNQESYYSELEGKYSLIVHDPNDAFNRITNRLTLTYDEETSQIYDISIIKNKL